MGFLQGIQSCQADILQGPVVKLGKQRPFAPDLVLEPHCVQSRLQKFFDAVRDPGKSERMSRHFPYPFIVPSTLVSSGATEMDGSHPSRQVAPPDQ
jgi:hypothetical protein